VVLGSLSPRTRNAQVQIYEDKKVDYSLVEKRIKSEISIDPDCWVVEIEDKNGINYFEGI